MNALSRMSGGLRGSSWRRKLTEPRFLARYIAVSALLIKSPPVLPSLG